MRNAGPIHSPTDPFAAVPLPESATIKKPRIEGLQPGVTPELGPEPDVAGPVKLPPVAQPPQPWPMTKEQLPEPPPPPAPVFGVTPPSDAPKAVVVEHPRHRLLPSLLLVAGVLAALAYLVPAVMMSGSVLRGTTVAGVDIGGLSVTEAADKLRAQLEPVINQPLTIDVAGRRESLHPDAAGLELDVVATINQASSGFPSPLEVWRGLTGTTPLQPKIAVNDSQLARTVEGLAQSFDRPAKEGRVVFAGLEPRPVYPRAGVVLDKQAATRLLQQAVPATGQVVTLPVKTAEPRTSKAAVDRAVEQARTAVSAPVVLTLHGRSVQLSPQVIAANLTFVAGEDGELAPRFAADRVRAAVEPRLVDAAQAPRDATYQVAGDRLVLVPARSGRGVDEERLAADVAKVVTRADGRVVPVALSVVRPRVTDDALAGMGIKEKVAEFATPYECCPPRTVNIRLMAERLDGHLVKPGETFSLYETVGEPTAEAGYVPAPQLVGGRMATVVGGGASQVATTLFNAVYRGGFEIVERHPFDQYMPPYPEGVDAAVLYPKMDLKWRNDSEYGVLVKVRATGTSVAVSLWSTRRYDKVEVIQSARRAVTPFTSDTSSAPGCVAQAGQPGFTVDVTRVLYAGGKEVRREDRQTVRYRPRAQVTCASSPD
ncbi:VanW family protein [Thermoactinospora rubra]|uniref:VanW family protein n=1 Tax=Thermoactinospora rubra TaxID=1088767 RepID=UPI000A1207B7|nr:VanW family protein [Thermoactinospora rubra]